MEILKDRKRQKQGIHASEGSRCSHAHLAVQAGGWCHGLAYRPSTPGDQHLTGPTPLLAQVPSLLVAVSWVPRASTPRATPALWQPARAAEDALGRGAVSGFPVWYWL